mmetsp:Transcript_24452/g.33709  ORF Transcript_24452/g.33709 Transcript_24452/m.33709 type:complete len:95 (-) Transcript_24452:4-288(-)
MDITTQVPRVVLEAPPPFVQVDPEYSFHARSPSKLARDPNKREEKLLKCPHGVVLLCIALMAILFPSFEHKSLEGPPFNKYDIDEIGNIDLKRI